MPNISWNMGHCRISHNRGRQQFLQPYRKVLAAIQAYRISPAAVSPGMWVSSSTLECHRKRHVVVPAKAPLPHCAEKTAVWKFKHIGHLEHRPAPLFREAFGLPFGSGQRSFQLWGYREGWIATEPRLEQRFQPLQAGEATGRGFQREVRFHRSGGWRAGGRALRVTRTAPR